MKRPALLCGVVFFFLSVAVAALLYLRWTTDGFSARREPTRMELMLANVARSAATPERVKTRRNPVALTPETLQQGMAHYADHCAQCHGNNGAGQTMLGNGMYPKPPDMRLAATQGKSDGELFTIIENGIRLSGMPAFGGDPATENDSWKLVLFLRRLPRLTSAEELTMQHLNPRSPAEMLEEKAEENFLSGGDPVATAAQK